MKELRARGARAEPRAGRKHDEGRADSGHPHGLREPGAPRGHPCLLRGHPRRAAGPAGGRGRADRALPAHRRPLAAQRDHGGQRRARGRDRPPGLRGHEALAPLDRRCGRRGPGRRSGAHRRARARPPLLAHVDRRLPGPSRDLDGRAELSFVESWHDHEPYIELLADRVQGTARRLHGAQPSGADPRRRRPLSRPAARDVPARRRARRVEHWSFAFQSE